MSRFGERVRGVALAELLAGLEPARHDLAFRVYVALRGRKVTRELAAELAARACAAADAGADLASIAAELRVPIGLLVARPPGTARVPDVTSAPLDAAPRDVARSGRAPDAWSARAMRAAPAPVRRGAP